MSTPGILIVSAATGTGHTRAGEALRQEFAQSDPRQVVEHLDLLELAPRWVRTAYGDGYGLIAARAPWLWRQVYRRTDAQKGDQARWGPVAQRILFREFRRLLLSRPWSVCLCSHFLPGQLAAGGPGFPPFALVITDLTLHHFWAQPRVGRYFVATEQVADGLRARLPGARANATGIPIAPRFASAPGRSEARASLGLDPHRPAVLVMGGGLGLGVEAAAEAALKAEVEGLQVLAVCGRNRAATERLRAAGASRLHVFEYVHDIERYIAAADLVVTKPGGLTTSEVVALGRPLLLTRPIPGQEEGNTRVLRSAGAAISAENIAMVRHEIERAFGEPGLLASLTAAAREFGRPHAAATIAGLVRSEYLRKAAA